MKTVILIFILTTVIADRNGWMPNAFGQALDMIMLFIVMLWYFLRLIKDTLKWWIKRSEAKSQNAAGA